MATNDPELDISKSDEEDKQGRGDTLAPGYIPLSEMKGFQHVRLLDKQIAWLAPPCLVTLAPPFLDTVALPSLGGLVLLLSGPPTLLLLPASQWCSCSFNSVDEYSVLCEKLCICCEVSTRSTRVGYLMYLGNSNGVLLVLILSYGEDESMLLA
jgi:hypothetical protein